jgi:hypothetical protein
MVIGWSFWRTVAKGAKAQSNPVLLLVVGRWLYMSLIRPLPPISWWAFGIGLTLVVACIVIAGVLESPVPFLPIAALIIFGEWRGTRCPECGRKMRSRKVPLQGGPEYRLYYECPHCEGLWDPNLKFDPSGD